MESWCSRKEAGAAEVGWTCEGTKECKECTGVDWALSRDPSALGAGAVVEEQDKRASTGLYAATTPPKGLEPL